jgi:hypothetical protein
LFTFFCSFSYSQLLFKISNDSLKVLSYSGGDEFNAPRLNTDYWGNPWVKVNMPQNFRYNPENVVQQDGVVNFLMLKKDSVYTIQPHDIDSNFIKEQKLLIKDYKYPLGYSAGMIITHKKLHYGLYELRFKVEEGKGVWPAFWFFGGNKNEEIDAFELKGEKNDQIHVDMHCPYGCDKGYKNKLGFKTSWGGWLPISDYLHNGYNIMLLEWKQNEILWYLNGYPIAYFKGSLANPMNLYLNTQIAADGRAFKPGPDKTTVFPNNFYVDYIRVWKELKKDSMPVLRSNANVGLSARFESKYNTRPLTKRGLMYSRKKFNDEEGLVSLALSDKGKLYVTVLGNISATSTVSIQGKKGIYTVTEFSKENEFNLDPLEKELELLIKTKEKEFRKKFRVIW